MFMIKVFESRTFISKALFSLLLAVLPQIGNAFNLQKCSVILAEPPNLVSLEVKTEEAFKKHFETIQKRTDVGDGLTMGDLRFLYGVGLSTVPSEGVEVFQYEFLEEIRSSRNFKTDLARLYKVDPAEVSNDIGDFVSEKVKVFYGDIKYNGEFPSSQFEDLIAIHGNANFGPLRDAAALPALAYVFGNLSLPNVPDMESENGGKPSLLGGPSDVLMWGAMAAGL